MIHILKFIFAIHFLTSCNILRDVSDSETNLDDEFFQGRGLESLNNDLLSFWNLNETGASENRRDKIGANDFVWNMGSIFSSAGKIRSALDCSSMDVNNRFNNTSVSNLNFGSSQDFTVSLWVKVHNTAGNGMLFQLGTSGDRIDIQVLNNNEIDIWFNNASTSPNIPSVSFGDWNHFALVFDRDQGLYVYMNGEFTFPQLTTSTVRNYSFASLRACSDSAFITNPDASVDSIGIWGRKLNLEEIRALYQQNNNLD